MEITGTTTTTTTHHRSMRNTAYRIIPIHQGRIFNFRHITRRTRLIQGISTARKSRRYLQVPKMGLHVPAGTSDETLTGDAYTHAPEYQHTSSTSSNGPIQSSTIGSSATSEKGAERHTRTAKGSRGVHIDNGPFPRASHHRPPHTTHGDTNRLAHGATASHAPGERALHHCGASRFTKCGASTSLRYQHERLAEPQRTIHVEHTTTHTFMESRHHQMAEQHPALATCKSTSPSEPLNTKGVRRPELTRVSRTPMHTEGLFANTPELRLSPMEPRPSLFIGDMTLSKTRSGSANLHITRSLGWAPHRHSDLRYQEGSTGNSESHGFHRHRSYFTGPIGAMEWNQVGIS